MENATKALLIAAAVLIVIILIAFGMRILNSGSGTQDQADATMNSAKAQAFNQKFEAYVGDRVSPSSVRNLFALIAQNNQSDPTHSIKNVKKDLSAYMNLPNNERQINLDSQVGFDTMDKAYCNAYGIEDISEVDNTKTYQVKCDYAKTGENAGYINWIYIGVMNNNNN